MKPASTFGAEKKLQDVTVEELERFIREELQKMNIREEDCQVKIARKYAELQKQRCQDAGAAFAELGLDSLELAALRRGIQYLD